MFETRESMQYGNSTETTTASAPIGTVERKRGAPYIMILTGQVGRRDMDGDWIVYHEQEFEVAGYDWQDLYNQLEIFKKKAASYARFNEWKEYKPYQFIKGKWYDKRSPEYAALAGAGPSYSRCNDLGEDPLEGYAVINRERNKTSFSCS